MSGIVTLNNGVKIPLVGLGTWKAEPGEVRAAVAHALKAGYRHLDCAHIYLNEQEVGQGIKDSGVPREEIFITSKVWCLDHEDVEKGLSVTLNNLGVDYVDLYLIHWPVRLVQNGSHPILPVNPDGTRAVDSTWDQAVTWRQMEAIYADKKARAIGVSNFSIPYLEKLQKTWQVVPAVNQVELHPFLPQPELIEWCKAEGITMEAYSPLGSSNSTLLTDPVIAELAGKYGVSPATVLISYHTSQGVVVLPKSVSPARIASNLQTIVITEEDLSRLAALVLEGKKHRTNKPDWGSDLGFDDWF